MNDQTALRDAVAKIDELQRGREQDTLAFQHALAEKDAEIAQLKALHEATVANANMDWETATAERDEAARFFYLEGWNDVAHARGADFNRALAAWAARETP